MQVEVNQDQITALNTRMKKLMIVTVEKVNMATAKHKYINLNIHTYNSAFFLFCFCVIPLYQVNNSKGQVANGKKMRDTEVNSAQNLFHLSNSNILF